uniref:DOP1 leucine zipper like protein A n=1 Tax=Eptatretus burgeri TaxID=7764 RepID=A0A8C4QLP7_EPTBU
MREDKKTVEVVKTANLLFSSFEPYYIWDYISRQFQDCCRMSGGGAGRVRRESGLSEQELTVCELCVLTDFLLDIVSLESYIEIQTGHLPRLLLLLVTCMSRYMDSLSLVELSDMLRLCSKILSRVQPPLVPTLVPHGGVDAVSITKAPSIAEGTKGEAPASSTSQNISISALAAATLPETGFSDFVQCRSHRPTGHGTEEVEDSLGVQNKQQERGHVTQASESNVRDFEVDKGSSNCGADSKRSSSELRDKEVLDLSHRKNEGETKEEEQEKNEKEEKEEEEKMEETKVKEGMIEEGWEGLADLTETGKTTMQLCVELFQGFYTQFLCRYVLGSEFIVTNFVRDIAVGASNNDGLRNCELWKKADGTAMLPGIKECRKHSQYTDNNVGALTAACQLFLECSSFPVYVAEGSPSSPCHEASSCTEQFPDAVPMWLQSLLACCCLPCHFGPDPFPTQAVAIGCFLDLLNLTHSISSSTGRVGESGGANSPGMSECSPSHGRVAVLIVPPLTQCHVDVITRDTLFFQRVAEILWVHLTHEVPKHQVCAVDLLQQLHGLASGSAVCEDVISRDLASHITALRVEAHKKFAVLWHLTRDVQRGKATAFTRTFDRSLLLMLESLWTARDNASRSVALSWLRQVIQRHDIPRILEPLLLLLLHPKTQRVALSYAVHRIQPKTSAAIEVGEPGLDKVVTEKWDRNASNRDGDESTTEMRICVHASTEQGGAVVSEGVRTDAMPPLISVSLRVNPLGSSQSPQSSCESLNDDQENEQPQSTVSNHVGIPPAFQRDEEEVGHVLEVLVDEVSRGIDVEQVSNRSSGEENKEENDEPEEEEESEDCKRECSLTSSECEPSSTASSPERHCGDVEEGEPWQGNILHGLVRPSSLPDLCVHKGSDVVSTSLTPDGTGESAEAWKEGLVDKSRPIVGSHKSTGALDSSPRSGANSAWQVPRGYGGDAASLEAWYIPGEAEGGESFIDDKDERIVDVDGEVDRNKESMNSENHRAQTSVTGLIEQSKGHTFPMVHPLYQHVLLYLQPYDTGRVVHVLTALRAILYAYPSTFVSAISTTGMSSGSSPRLSWLQDLLTRHHAALSGRDFYTIAPGPVIAQGAGSVGFRSAMYLEVLLSLCLAFLRSHYPSQARASSRDVAENRDVQVLSAELLTIIVSTLARIVETGVGSALVPGGGSVSGSGYASFLVDLLARCKMQRVLLHCLLAGVAVPHLRHKLCAGIITSSKIQVKANEEEEESPGNNRPVDILIDESADASGLQTQLLELLQALIVLEYRILSLSEDPDAGFTELCAPESKQQQGQQQQQNSQQAEQHKPRHHQQQRKPSVPLLRYEPSRPITEQEMLGWTVLHALSIQSQSCSAHLCWIAMVTSSLPYLGQVLGRLSVAVTTQLCHNLDAVVAQLEWEVGLCSSRPSVLLQDVPLDYIVFLLEGVTTIVHHCLLDSFPSPNQTQGNSKFLNEARAALLPSLPTVIMTASSLWGLMSLFDSQGAEGAHVMQSGLPAATTINLGSTKILRQKLLALLSPLCLQHGAMFLAAVARVWDGRRQHRAVSRVKVTTWASQEQMLLVELVRAIGTLHCDSIVCTVRDVMKQPPGEIAREKHFSLEVCLLQFLFAYIQSVAVSSFVDAWPSLLSLLKDCSQLNLPPPGALLLLGILNDFVLKTPPLESKKDQRDLQDITQRLVEAVATVAGSSLEQTTWLRRNLEVKAGPQVSMDISGQQDVKDILLSPVAEMVSSTPSAYSVHALTLLAEVLAHLLDMVFRSDEKEKVVPLLISIMHYVVPYLKNHSTHNAPSYRACVQLLNSLSGYQYTRRAWKKEVFDLFMDPAFFQIEPFCASQWRSIIDHLMTHDKITFRDFMARVVVAQSSSLNNLFSSREAELEQRVVLLKRLAFAIFASELDQYQKLLPDIQERLAESLRLPQMPTLHAQVFVVFRVLLLRISPHHLTSLWPTMITELVQVFMQMEQEMVAEDDLSR